MNKKDSKAVSAVIPTFNSWTTLDDAIKSLKKQTEKLLEIIIVDNASSDDTYENVKRSHSDVRLFKNKTNEGVTGGRNLGIRKAKGKLILFFDHDMIADRDMIKNLLDVIDSDREIGIVTPKIYYFKDKGRIWSAGTGINLLTGQVMFRGGKDLGQYEKVEEVQVAPAAMLVTKAVISSIKFFDDRYFATFEDTDFCFRAKLMGYKTFYSPKAIAYHQISTDPEDEKERLMGRAYWVGKNRIMFMKDFGKSFFIFSLFVPGYVFYYLKMSFLAKKPLAGLNFLRGTIVGFLT